jgi:predicted TIM-barrel fold metal-dependent hydrolase
MSLFSRRRLLIGTGGMLSAGLAGAWGLRRLARPSLPAEPPSDECRDLVAAAWEGLDPSSVLDTHVHVIGLGSGDSGCYVHEKALDLIGHPVERARFEVYRRASQIEDLDQADAEYMDVLLRLVRSDLHGGRVAILAYDQVYDAEGRPRVEQSQFYTPNDYVLALAAEHPDVLVPIASVHPARPDALDELSRVAEAGVIAIKWLPNAQRIDPSAEQFQPFFDRLVELDLPLLTHAGEEQAVEAVRFQKLGNPLRLRRPLDTGVKIIVAHCGGLGKGQDLDLEGPDWPMVPNFELFRRLLDEEKYVGQLYGDLSATVLTHRASPVLPAVLSEPALASRMLNGSDYPVSAIDILIRLGPLVDLGVLDEADIGALRELNAYNPLAFDFVLKRRLRWEAEDGSAQRLPDSCFQPSTNLFSRLG